MDHALEQKCINTIRTLSIDAIEKANSGHPGLPMGAAPMAYALWSRFLKHNPADPNWFDRDRFILSAGHGSMLLYSLLHLSGYDLSMDEIKNFRQWGSATPGHPEFGHTVGVEATTGPLGQGVAMAVGMAMAERHLAAVYNRDGHDIIDHYTYSICGDGDLMEGVSAEAASLAGHLKLGKLIILYDSNDISLDGETSFAFTEDVLKRYEAYGWQVLRVEDGNDVDEISRAIEQAQAEPNKPTLIEVRTVIGYGSPNKAGTHKVHGAPLGEDEAKLTKEAYEWPHEPFHVPDDVREHFAALKEQGARAQADWEKNWEAYQKAFPELAAQLKLAMAGELPEGWDQDLPLYEADHKPLATRSASGEALNAIANRVPWFIGGSADLASSNKTELKDAGVFHAEDYSGRNIWFGVREHAMGAALNGMMLHGGVRAFGATFFVFSDYLRPAIRLSALMKQPVIYVFTHDSIAVGEDGPTHEPIEQLPSLRAMPDLTVIRPADANETVEAYRYALEKSEQPVVLVLSRQNLPVLAPTATIARENLSRGAYVIADPDGQEPQAILMASGSEVSLALEAQKVLADKGVPVRVVSMPSWELFEEQSPEYKESVLPSQIKTRLAIEMAHPLGWEKYVGDQGAVMGIETFGASAPGNKVIEEFGFTVDHVVARVGEILNK
ncbi:MAG: transketolase [Bacillaceae bacterium]|nr:transketolase [Bacillaceae bacterium]